jgi:hypothetical protein
MPRWVIPWILAIALLVPYISVREYVDVRYYPNSLYLEVMQFVPAVLISEAVLAVILAFAAWLILPPILKQRYKPIKGAHVQAQPK